MKFTVYALLVPKMHHIKFEKNWSSGYQEVKNVQMLTLYIMLGPASGQNLYPEDNEIHNFNTSLPALHHHAFSFSYILVVSEEDFFKNWSILTFLCPAPKEPEGQET
jgi:hypothetical protein